MGPEMLSGWQALLYYGTKNVIVAITSYDQIMSQFPPYDV
jgi:hypothetical protein